MATGTRAAKQMEEQIGTLLATLQEQGQRQEQLAREQAEFIQQMEQLKEEQRERQAEFSARLELLARDQRLTLEQWTGRQERMEERVRSLEAELRSSIRVHCIREVLQGGYEKDDGRMLWTA